MIRLVVTRGFGNGTFAGTIADVVTRGYTIGAAPPPGAATPGGIVRRSPTSTSRTVRPPFAATSRTVRPPRPQG